LPVVLSLARSTMPSSTTLFSNSRKVQRARPLGGLEHAKAISLASFSPPKSRATAGVARCLRLNTASKPSSTSCLRTRWRLLGRIRWSRRFVFDLDGLKALLGDPQGARTILVAAPNRQGAARRNLLDEAFGQELGDDLASGAAGQIGRPLKGAVVALRCRRQQHQLGIGQFHGALHSVDDGECRRHHRSPAMAARPAGQDSEMLIAAQNGHSTALFAPECQSFLDNLRAGFGAKESANDSVRFH
jgi:hypothetical protein